MRLKEPFAPFLGNICSAYFGIVSPAAVEKYGDEFGKNPVGTGPWKFKEWRTGEEIVLEWNPDYKNFHSYVENKGAPLVGELVFRDIPDEQTQIAAFETGEINVLAVLPHAVADFESNPDVQLFRVEQSVAISFLEFHMDPPQGEYGAIFHLPFDDLRVRQAVAYGVNADEIIATVLEGLAVRNYGPLPTGVACYDPAIEQYGYHYDPQRAAQLLDEAGWALPPGGSVRQKDGQPLQVTLWTEPHMLLMMTETAAGIGLYRPEEYRNLVVQASRVVDHEERCRLYVEAMKIMLRDAAMVPLWSPVSVVGARKEVKGFKIGPQGIYVYEDATIES